MALHGRSPRTTSQLQGKLSSHSPLGSGPVPDADGAYHHRARQSRSALCLLFLCYLTLFLFQGCAGCRQIDGRGGATGRTRSIQTSRKIEVLQGHGVPPDIMQRLEIPDLQLKQRPLRYQHLRVSHRHVLIFIDIELVSALGARNQLSTVALHGKQCLL